MIWEPFVIALVLGLIISAGLYFAYLWPAIEPLEETDPLEAATAAGSAQAPSAAPGDGDAADDDDDATGSAAPRNGAESPAS